MGIKFFITRVENIFIYWPGRLNLGPGRHFQPNYQLGKPAGHISQGHLYRVFQRPTVLKTLRLKTKILYLRKLGFFLCVYFLTRSFSLYILEKVFLSWSSISTQNNGDLRDTLAWYLHLFTCNGLKISLARWSVLYVIQLLNISLFAKFSYI